MVTSPQDGLDMASPVPSNVDDRIYPATRVVAGLLVIILLVFASILYIWPLETDTRFAWPISPAMTPLLMGSGYFAGAYYFFRLALGRNWSHVGATLPAVAVFATVMLITTLIHWDRFTHDHLTFYVWTVIYLIAPPLVIGIWYWNGKRDPGFAEAGADAVPIWTRAVVAGLGLGAMTLAAVLFFAPDAASDFWPWTVSPLTSRVLAGWFTLPAATLLLLALDARWSIWRVPLQTTVIWAALMLIGISRAWDDFNSGSLATWIFLVGVVLVAVPFLWYMWHTRLLR